MERAGRILVEALRLLEGKIRPGVSTAELDEAAERFIRSRGGAPTFKGYRGFPGSICASPNAMVVHGIPGPYRLKPGDIISVDVGVTLDGWVADADGAASGRHHRLDRNHHPLLQQRAPARLAVVGHLRVLVHAAPDPVPDQRAHDRQPGTLGDLLDRAGHIAHAIPGPALGDACVQRLLGRGE